MMSRQQGSRQLYLFLIVISSLYCINDAFTTTSRSSLLKTSQFINLQNKQQQQQQSPSQLFVVDPTQITDALTTSPDVLLWQAQWLADAAAAVVAESQQNGWWESWLNIFKSGLELIHGLVDKPLRDAGIEQTWGISIALFTFSIRLALVPLSIEQSKSAEYIKVLKPYTKEINQKFANNERAKSQAIAKLYEDAKQNPLSGCLVSLAQLPIFLGLYRGVRLLAVDGELNEPFLWIPSLEGPVTAETDFRGLDWLVKGWVDGAPAMGWETTLAFLAMPLILVLLQSFTMSTLQPPADEGMGEEERATLERTQLVLKFLPLLIGFFSLQVPAGLTIYWFTSNIFTLSQSLTVKAYFAANPPKIELPDYWDSALTGDVDNMTPEERRQASVAGLALGPTFEELIDQSKFHVYVDRTQSLREQSDAWKRASKNGKVPPQLEGWVAKHNTLTSASSTSGTTINKETVAK